MGARQLECPRLPPSGAPEWAHDRNQLWNEAERAEKRKDAQLAREFEVALPHEFTEQQREWLVKDFVREAFVRQGYVADIAIHAPDKESDERNYHAHIMVTMRTLGADGFAAKKDRSLNSTEQLDAWREQWAHLANRHLERHGHEERVDHRSLEAQGIEREPTVHLGYAAIEMDKRGAQSDRMDALREVLARNEIRFEMKAIDRELIDLGRSSFAETSGDRAAGRQAEPQQQAERAPPPKREAFAGQSAPSFAKASEGKPAARRVARGVGRIRRAFRGAIQGTARRESVAASIRLRRGFGGQAGAAALRGHCHAAAGAQAANHGRVRAGRSATYEGLAGILPPHRPRGYQRSGIPQAGGVRPATQPRPRRRAIALAQPVKGRNRRGGNQRQAPRSRARERPRANTPAIRCLP